MIVTIRLELDDEERVALWRHINPTTTRKPRPATRAEVREYVAGSVAAALREKQGPRPSHPLRGDAEQRVYDAMIAAGKSESFCRGWLSACAVYGLSYPDGVEPLT
jgi:hypothetical protein